MGKAGGTSKKRSTRVDLTPMVDLGFLLITFFIFTTDMAQPKALRLFLPKGLPDNVVGESAALTVCPIAGDRIFYYHGNLEEALLQHLYGITSFSLKEGIGHIIREKQASMEHIGKNRNDMMLIIKPADESNYKNTVDMLDEVSIHAVTRYAITEISEKELNAIKRKER